MRELWEKVDTRTKGGWGMKVAVYDNPATFRREAWVDGTMEGFISFETLSGKGFSIHKLAGKIPWIIDDSPIVPGRIRGDKDAIRKAKGGGE